MCKKVTFRMVAYTDAAGKFDDSAYLNGNEDNFYVDDNLSDDIPAHCAPNQEITLSECGMIMAVADGMGGMNAGEVASMIVTDTIKEYFAPGQVDRDTASDPHRRKRYLEALIKEADRRVKDDAKRNPEHDGMGSTVIIAWVVGTELTVSWCGDSRAYRFNPINGIEPLSEDHSYVQDLVRQGKLTYEQTFGHPNGNIVTRSLGDPDRDARPETRQFELCNDDIILLCSDGLSGVLRDRKTYNTQGEVLPGENIEDIIREHCKSMTDCKEALFAAAERADWYDNVTVILCQITGGAHTAVKKTQSVATIAPRRDRILSEDGGKASSLMTLGKWKKQLIIAIAVVIVLLLGFVVLKYPLKFPKASKTDVRGKWTTLYGDIDSLRTALKGSGNLRLVDIRDSLGRLQDMCKPEKKHSLKGIEPIENSYRALRKEAQDSLRAMTIRDSLRAAESEMLASLGLPVTGVSCATTEGSDDNVSNELTTSSPLTTLDSAEGGILTHDGSNEDATEKSPFKYIEL